MTLYYILSFYYHSYQTFLLSFLFSLITRIMSLMNFFANLNCKLHYLKFFNKLICPNIRRFYGSFMVMRYHLLVIGHQLTSNVFPKFCSIPIWHVNKDRELWIFNSSTLWNYVTYLYQSLSTNQHCFFIFPILIWLRII